MTSCSGHRILACRPCRAGRALATACLFVVLIALAINHEANAQAPKNADDERQDDYRLNEFPARPAPDWVRMVDQGDRNPNLAGLFTPDGIGVDVIADAPTVINPVGMTFAADGTPHVLEWTFDPLPGKHTTYEVTYKDGTTTTIDRMQKSVPDVVKTLRDSDGDGVYDTAETVMDDLEIPSSILLHDGWTYLSSVGRIFRRRPDGNGGWEEQTVIQGLCGFHHHQASGMTLGHDGWMYITSGDNDNRGEGSDGSRATVLRTGAIFRCRPDGSDLHEFARGFRNPYRDVAFDEFFNVFHVDNDQEDGSRFQGVRLMHIQVGDDFGWRLMPGTVCCQTDFSRAAVFGERPGTVPSLLKTGRGSPAGLLIYNGTAFPEYFRGLLIYPDVYRKVVRAYEVERRGSSFAVVRQFDLMRSDDPLFRPCQAVVGPDGAIYIVDWRTDSGGAGRLSGDGQHGRIYRLTWTGTSDEPAIEPGTMDAWAKLPAASDAELLQLFKSRDFELRRRAQRELVSRGDKVLAEFLELIQDESQPATARALAIGGACQFYDASVEAQLLQLLGENEHPELRRLAAEAIGRHTTWNEEKSPGVLAQLRQLLDVGGESRVQRGIALAFATVAALSPDEQVRYRAVDPLFGKYFLALQSGTADPHLIDGYVRAIERLGADAKTVLMTIFSVDNPDTLNAGVRMLESGRTREMATILDAVIESRAESELLSSRPRLLARLIAAYRYYELDPPVGADAVAHFAMEHPEVPVEVQLTALETIGLSGTAQEFDLSELALRLLQSGDTDTRQAAITAIGNARLVGTSGALVEALADNARGVDEQQSILRTLAQLRSQPKPFTGEPSPAGVETVLQPLLGVAEDVDAPAAIRGDSLRLVGQINPSLAQPVAVELLESQELALAAAAIDVLAADRELAISMGESFVAGDVDRRLLPQVAAALRRHVPPAGDQQLQELLTNVFRGGLLVSLEENEIRRVEELVNMQGDPIRGRDVYLSSEAQCAKCHKLEGIGGQVGPDLTKVWETHAIAKLMESMIDPSKEIKEGYATWTVSTTAGQVFSGLKIKDDASEVVLRDAEGKDVRIPANEIDEKFESQQSIMPEGVIAQLSFEQFIDLVAFLKSREAQATLAGMLSATSVIGPFPPGTDFTNELQAAAPQLQPVTSRGTQLEWKPLIAGTDGTFDLRQTHPFENAAVFAVAEFDSPRDQDVTFDVWFDDEMQVMLNGKVAHNSTNVHTLESFTASAKAGSNRVLIKITNGGTDFAFRLFVRGEGVRMLNGEGD